MINYIVALYFGKRRNDIVQNCINHDPYHLLKKHMLSFIDYELPHVHKVTFVINESENREIDLGAEEELRKLTQNKKINTEFEILYSPDNKHISYGAWHYGVINGLEDTRTQYFFLLEDDYVPCTDYFYLPYVERCDSDIAYVCQLWQPSMAEPRLGVKASGRVAITNGLLNADAARKIYEKYGYCFQLDVTPDYEVLVNSSNMDPLNKKYILSGVAQKNFVKIYEYDGYSITDLGPNWKQLFLNTKGIRIYGEGKSHTIEPIHRYDPIDEEKFK